MDVFVVADAIALLRFEEDTTACRRRDKLVETADAVNRACLVEETRRRNSKSLPVRVIVERSEHKRNSSPPPVRRLVLSEVEVAEACRRRDKPAEATDAVFRLIMCDSNVHRCGHANSVLEHDKQHTSTGVEAGVEEAVTNVIVWPSTDAGRPGLASSQRTPGKSAVAERAHTPNE